MKHTTTIQGEKIEIKAKRTNMRFTKIEVYHPKSDTFMSTEKISKDHGSFDTFEAQAIFGGMKIRISLRSCGAENRWKTDVLVEEYTGWRVTEITSIA